MRVLAKLRDLSDRRPYFAIWPATVLLFAVSPLFAPGSLSRTALLSMLPFASILALAAIGQTLVVQQRGFDLSVAGMISLSTVIITLYPNGSNDKLLGGIALVLAACIATGLINGIAVTRFGITPLVATLGVNAVLVGAVLQITHGSLSAVAAPGLSQFGLGRTIGIPNTVLVAGGVIVLVSIVMHQTVLGRRFVAVGSNPQAAFTAGINVRSYELSAYVLSSLCYGGAGILLAGLVSAPGLSPGNAYLLPSVAAVVLGGTSLAGGNASVVATAIGALFLAQLQQVVTGMGAPFSVQEIIQGGIIALGMALRNVPWKRLIRRQMTVPRVFHSDADDQRSGDASEAALHKAAAPRASRSDGLNGRSAQIQTTAMEERNEPHGLL